MFERFTDRARRVVVLAQEEARMLEHNYIGSEHLLLGLVHEAEGVAGQALAMQGIDLEAVRAKVEEIVPAGGAVMSGHVPFNPRAKKVLAQGLREAVKLGHSYIGTEHILLGLVTEGELEGVLGGWDVLEALEVDVEKLRGDIQEMVGPPVAPVPQPRSWIGILSDWARADDDAPLDFDGAQVPEKIQRLLAGGIRPSTPVGMGEEIEIQIMGKTRKLVLRTVTVDGARTEAIFVEKK